MITMSTKNKAHRRTKTGGTLSVLGKHTRNICYRKYQRNACNSIMNNTMSRRVELLPTNFKLFHCMRASSIRYELPVCTSGRGAILKSPTSRNRLSYKNQRDSPKASFFTRWTRVDAGCIRADILTTEARVLGSLGVDVVRSRAEHINSKYVMRRRKRSSAANIDSFRRAKNRQSLRLPIMCCVDMKERVCLQDPCRTRSTSNVSDLLKSFHHKENASTGKSRGRIILKANIGSEKETVTTTDLALDSVKTEGWQRRWTVVLLCFCAFCLCNMDRVNMSITILPMSEAFNWDMTTVGIIQSSFFWGYLLTQVAGGVWSDRLDFSP